MNTKTRPFRFLQILVGSAAALTCLSSSALAAVITVPNYSFEDPVTSNFTNTAIAGYDASILADWDFGNSGLNVSTGVQFNAVTLYPTIPDGTQWSYLNSQGNSGTLTSHASLTTVAANTDYTLTVALGNRLDGGYADLGTYTLSLLVNGVSVASNTLAGSTITDGTFVDKTLLWNSGLTSTGALTIQLQFQNTTDTNFSQGNFDNVRLTADLVPEPSTLGFLALSALGVVTMRRRRRA